jgi:drug/metabolite transporter (DMT)-like permease
MNRTATLYALVSAALFGVSTPAAKSLVGTVDPIVLAGLLYCGAGIGVAMLRRIAHAVVAPAAREQPLRRQDIPWLAGAFAAGGVAGPILLMTGLARADAAAASLLLTLESAATALMAWFIFHENFNRRIALASSASLSALPFSRGPVHRRWRASSGPSPLLAPASCGASITI